MDFRWMGAVKIVNDNHGHGNKIKKLGLCPSFFRETKMETEESLGLKKENAPQKKSWCESTEGRKYG